MTTYWFTVAEGDVYRRHAERLRRSLLLFDISLQILDAGGAGPMAAKRRKISGLLEAPASCARVVYLDADTLVLDPARLERSSGSWRVPWRMPIEGQVPKDVDPQQGADRLRRFHRGHGLSDLEPGGLLDGVEWNSGVIAGERELLAALAREWAVWWDRLLELFDGRFRRDQVSYRIAYHRTLSGAAGLPAECNWIASYFGVNPNAAVLHRTMVRRVPWLDEQWERIVARRLAGEDVSTRNRVFDLGAVAAGRPPLHQSSDLDHEAIGELLQQALAFLRPRRVLLCGAEEDRGRFRPLVCAGGTSCTSVGALSEALQDVPSFDFVLFCAGESTMTEAERLALAPGAVCCFAGVHDLASYLPLHDFEYVRILDRGFGLFSRAPGITRWPLGRSAVASR